MTTQPPFTCSKSTWETPKQCVNTFQSNHKGTRTMFLTAFWCLCGYFWTDFTHCSGVSIADFFWCFHCWLWSKSSWKSYLEFSRQIIRGLQTIDHEPLRLLFSTDAKCSGKLTFLTSWYTHLPVGTMWW